MQKPAVNAQAIEASVMNLWHEFLSGFFNGQPHVIGAAAEAVVFPVADLLFQQSAPPQPMSNPAITLVWCDGAPRRRRCWEMTGGRRQEMFYQGVYWNFWIRASGTNSRRACRQVSDLLYALLCNSAATHPLAQRGIQRILPQTPRVVQETDYALRLITAGATLRYPVLSQTQVSP